MDFFLDMNPPMVTAQEHKGRGAGGGPRFYDTARLKHARTQFETMLAAHRASSPLEGPVDLRVDWHFSMPKMTPLPS